MRLLPPSSLRVAQNRHALASTLHALARNAEALPHAHETVTVRQAQLTTYIEGAAAISAPGHRRLRAQSDVCAASLQALRPWARCRCAATQRGGAERLQGAAARTAPELRTTACLVPLELGQILHRQSGISKRRCARCRSWCLKMTWMLRSAGESWQCHCMRPRSTHCAGSGAAAHPGSVAGAAAREGWCNRTHREHTGDHADQAHHYAACAPAG